MKFSDRLRLGSAAALMALAAGAAATAQPSASIAIQNVRIFDGEKVIPNGTVIVRDGKIAALGARVAVAQGAQTIDGAGKTLIPGLIDAHVHLVDSYKANGGVALEEAAVYGVTTTLDLNTGNPEDYVAARKAVKAGQFTNGADLYTSGPGATTQQVKDPSQAQAWVDWHKAGGADYIKIFAYAPTDRGGPDAALKPETMKAVIDAAHKDGLMAISHSLNEPISRQLVKDGLDGLVHISPSALNAPDFGKLLASNGAFQSTNIIGVAPVSYRSQLADSALAAYMPAFMIDGLRNARPPAAGGFETEIANFKTIKKGGALMLAGTDAFYPYNPVLHAELEILVKDGGATPVEALKMATSNVAKAYKLKDRGRIAKGMRADLVLVNGDPTTNIVDTRKIDAVWIAGRKIDREAQKAKLTAITAPPPRGGGPGPAPAIAPAAAQSGRYQGPLVVQKINDHIYWSKGPSTSNNSNNAFIIGKTGVILFDTKNTLEDEKTLLAEIAKITDKPIKAVLLSHSDGDHINGLPLLPKGVPIYAHDYAAKVMRESAAKGGERAANRAYLPQHTFKTKANVTIDGIDMQLLNFGPGHIGGDLIAYIPVDKIVFMGDIIITEIEEPFMHMDNGGSPTGIISNIKGMIALDADTYVSGHGEIVNKADLQRRLALYEAKATRVKAMIAEAKSLAEIKQAVGDPPPPAAGARGGRATFTDYLYQEATRK